VPVPDAPEELPPPVPPPVPLPAPAPPVAGPAGVVVAGVVGVAAEEPPDADGPADEFVPVVLVVEVVEVVVVLLGVEVDALAEVGTVNGGTSDVSGALVPPPHAARPIDSATPVTRAATKVEVRERLRTGIGFGAEAHVRCRGGPSACRRPGSR
jgi:hypothetical protein